MANCDIILRYVFKDKLVSQDLKLLVVDDDADLIELLKIEIKKTNYQMTAVSTVEDAFSYLNQEKFFCAVLDINLKSSSSAPIFSMIKEDSNHPNFNIPIIIMSAFFNNNVIEKLHGKASGVLKKPFSKGQFLNILEHVRNKDKNILLQCQRLLDKCKEVETMSMPSFHKTDICTELRKEIYQKLEALLNLIEDKGIVVKGIDELPEDEFIISNTTEKLADEYTTVHGAVEVDQSVTVVKGGQHSDAFKLNNRLKSQNLDPAFARHSLNLLLEKIKNGADVDDRNELGQTALMLASYLGELEVVNNLINSQASVKNKSRDGKFPIHYAIMSANQEVVQAILQAGGKNNGKDSDGNSPFLLGVSRGNLVILKLLMEYDPILNIRNKNGEGAIAQAVRTGNLEMVKFLIENGLDPKVIDYNGKSCLDLAIKMNNSALIEYLKPKMNG